MMNICMYILYSYVPTMYYKMKKSARHSETNVKEDDDTKLS